MTSTSSSSSFITRFFGNDDNQKDFGPLPVLEFTNEPRIVLSTSPTPLQQQQLLQPPPPQQQQQQLQQKDQLQIKNKDTDTTESSGSGSNQNSSDSLNSDIKTATNDNSNDNSNDKTIVDVFMSKFQNNTPKPDKKFWMPDHSSAECFECSTPFTVLKRRHHCRLCGQIFCAKCSQHTIDNTKGEKIRVCTYCYNTHKNGQRINDQIGSPAEILPNTGTPETLDLLQQQQQLQQQQNGANQLKNTGLFTSKLINLPSFQSPFAKKDLPIVEPSPFELEQNLTKIINEIGGNEMNYDLSEDDTPDDDLSEDEVILPQSEYISNEDNNSVIANINFQNNSNSIGSGSSLEFAVTSGGSNSLIPSINNNKQKQGNHSGGNGGSGGAPGSLVTSFSMSALPLVKSRIIKTSADNAITNNNIPNASNLSSSHQGRSILKLSTSPSSPPPTPNSPSSLSSSLSLLPGLLSPPLLSGTSTTTTNSNSVPNSMNSSASSAVIHPLKTSAPVVTNHEPLNKSTTLISPNKKQQMASSTLISPTSLFFSDPSIVSLKSHPKTTNRSKFLEKYPLPRQESFSLPRVTKDTSPPLQPRMDMINSPIYNEYQSHISEFVTSLLEKENIDLKWRDIILDIATNACTKVKISVKDGDKMSTKEYIKIKKVPGSQAEYNYIDGVVMTKILTHKKMRNKFTGPKILLLSCSVEFQRVENKFLFFDQLLQQEREYLRILVSKIAEKKPDIVLVEKTVSRHAQDFLLEAGISLALNVKPKLLSRLSRSLRCESLPSVDHIQSSSATNNNNSMTNAQASSSSSSSLISASAASASASSVSSSAVTGSSSTNSINSLSTNISGQQQNQQPNQHNRTKKEPRQLGTCGQFRVQTFTEPSSKDDGTPSVQKKTLMYFERCQPELGATITLGSQDKETLSKIKNILEFAIYATHHAYLEMKFLADQSSTFSKLLSNPPSPSSPHIPSVSSALTSTTQLSCSPHIKFQLPRAYPNIPWGFQYTSQHYRNKKALLQCFAFAQSDSGQQQSVLQTYSEDEILGIGLSQAFDPSKPYPIKEESILNHQNISFSHSIFCNTNQCIPFELHSIDYYSENDMTLGEFLLKFCFNTTHVCTHKECNRPFFEHERTFMHANGRINIVIQKISATNTPLQSTPTQQRLNGTISIINRCKQCNSFSPEQNMSDSTWEMSFGKFLELSFYGSSIVGNYAECNHAMIKDHITYFYHQEMAAIFSYESLPVLELSLPPKVFEEANPKLKAAVRQREIELLNECANTVYNAIFEKFNELQEEGEERVKDLMPSLLEERQLILTKIGNHLGSDFIHSSSEPASRLTKLLYANFMTWNSQLSGLVNSTSLQKTKRATTLLSSHNNDGAMEATNSPSIGTSFNALRVSTQNADSLHSSFEKQQLSASQTNSSNGNSLLSNSSNSSNATSVGSPFVSSQPVPPAIVTSSPPLDSSSTTLPLITANGNNLLTTTSSPPLMGSDPKPISPISTSLNPHLLGQEVSGSYNATSFDSKSDLSVYNTSFTSYSNINHASPQREVKKLKIIDTIAGIVSSISSSKILGPTIPFILLDGSDNIAIYENEPSTTIAYTLTSQEFKSTFNELMQEELTKPSNLDVDSSVENPNVPKNDIGNFLKQKSNTEAEKKKKDTPLSRSVDRRSLATSVNGLGESTSNQSSPALTPTSTPPLVSTSIEELDINDNSGINNTNTSTNNSTPSPNSSTSNGVASNNSSINKEMFSDKNLRLSKLLVSNQRKEIRNRFKFEKNGYELNIFCTTYYPVQFSALREMVCSEDQFIESLTRSKVWVAKGGKSGSSWNKTLDDRYILKNVSKIELESFLDFAPLYFEYLCKSYLHQIPTALSKILGVYSVRWKDSNGKTLKKDLIVMENLFYNKNVTKTYDLKGSLRSRLVKNESEVLLDENLLQVSFSTPICLSEYDKTRISLAVWNDTAFLSSLNVMDYSLLTGIDSNSNQLVVGIIDYMRKFTWDKVVEMKVKQSGIMGGGGKVPTVISPKQYKIRFRDAMWLYFTMVPDKFTKVKHLLPSNEKKNTQVDNNNTQ